MALEPVADFPATLKHWRTVRQLSQSDLAHAAGIGRSHVIRLESGQTTPSLAVARSLADALGVSLDTLAPPGRIEQAGKK